VPDVLTPLLETVSGLLVVFIGLRLVWQRWLAFRPDRAHRHDHSHSHDHNHSHDHSHNHDHADSHPRAYTHDHGDGHTHAHLPPVEGLTLGSLVAMGVSGGLLPCPEALGIMVIAVGLNRILLGLGLIVSFSFGLAAVLIVIGILLVRSRSLVEHFGGIGSRWSSALPLASAVIVTPWVSALPSAVWLLTWDNVSCGGGCLALFRGFTLASRERILTTPAFRLPSAGRPGVIIAQDKVNPIYS
jgi:ABC-type nickel/cobalt efflux system permease component RcnA